MSALEFREAYQRDHVGPRYSGVLHFAVTNVAAAAGIAVALSFIHDLKPRELLIVPAATGKRRFFPRR
jgi:hypothetical protein